MIEALSQYIVSFLNARKPSLLPGVNLIKYGDVQPVAVKDHPAVTLSLDKAKAGSSKQRLGLEWSYSLMLYTVSAGTSDAARAELLQLLWDPADDVGLLPALHILTNSAVRLNGRCFFMRLGEDIEFGLSQNDGYSTYGAHLTLEAAYNGPALRQ
ncbi:hypothetical protein IJT93_10295 [bacterium]|nr:hypothetical protein [bacterium]